tara:strand:+ start:6872 stop:7549 length:678 start_codon:yes stop_codon:yes gene_type:complete
MQKIYIHLGCHKTGTTSLQRFFVKNTYRLRHFGFDYLPTPIGEKRKPHQSAHGRHLELGECAVREAVTKISNPNKAGTRGLSRKDLIKQTKDYIAEFLETSPYDNFIFSDEGLDYMRTQKEINDLVDLFPSDFELIPILTLRKKEEWIESCIAYWEERKMPQHPATSWVFEVENLTELLKENFPETIFLQYSIDMIRVVLDALGLQSIEVEDELYLNKRKLSSLI